MRYFINSISIVILLVLSSSGYAQDILNSNAELRVDFSYHTASTNTGSGHLGVTTSESFLLGLLTLQHNNGFYGQLGLNRSDIHSVRAGGRSFDPELESTGRILGFGYRWSPSNMLDEYIGLGFQNSDINEEGISASNSVKIFVEKDDPRWYSIIEVGYSAGDDIGMVGIAGRHAWFGNRVLGFGIAWGLGTGKYKVPEPHLDSSVDSANIGVIIMYRPTWK